MKKIALAACAAWILSGVVSLAQPPEGGRRPEGQQDRPRGERGPQEGRGERGPGGFGGPGGPGGQFRGGPPAFPLMVALDANQDGELSPEEISNAAAALKKLDKNNDGKIDASEMRPDFGGRGPGGPGGFGGGPGGGPGGGGFNPQAMIERMMQNDTNNDGKLSKDELGERMQGMLERADSNSDGFLSKEELTAAIQARQGEGAGRGRPEGDAGRGRPEGGRGRPEGEGRGRGGDGAGRPRPE